MYIHYLIPQGVLRPDRICQPMSFFKLQQCIQQYCQLEFPEMLKHMMFEMLAITISEIKATIIARSTCHYYYYFSRC